MFESTSCGRDETEVAISGVEVVLPSHQFQRVAVDAESNRRVVMVPLGDPGLVQAIRDSPAHGPPHCQPFAGKLLIQNTSIGFSSGSSG